MIENFNRFVLANIGALLDGLWVTTYVCFWAFLLAVVLGLIVCLIRMRLPYVRVVAIAYIEFCRATPVLVQLLWVNYVWPDIFGFPGTVTGAGIIALALQSSGYFAETFRSGIEGLPKGQIEAGLAVGLRPRQIMGRIMLPQVGLVMAPSLINQIAVIIKSSTLVSVIAIPDLMYEALRIVNQWFEPIEILTSVASVYFFVIFTLSMTANKISDALNTKIGLLYR